MSQTPDVLRENDLFLVNAGRNWTIVFDSRRFFRPYVSLGGYEYSAKSLSTSIKPSQYAFASAFRYHWNEATFIKSLHFCGAFEALTKELCGVERYFSGPSGSLPSTFPFWMRMRNPRKRGERPIGFAYQGMVDLDDSLYPMGNGEIVIPVEAKINNVQDIGWHKLAFPSNRFVTQKRTSFLFYKTGSKPRFIYKDKFSRYSNSPVVIPVYCAADPIRRSAFIYVFRELKVHYGRVGDSGMYARGFVLNDPKQVAPKKCLV
jgi:hypothetical protein